MHHFKTQRLSGLQNAVRPSGAKIHSAPGPHDLKAAVTFKDRGVKGERSYDSLKSRGREASGEESCIAQG